MALWDDDRYFKYLQSLVYDPKSQTSSYTLLFEQLHSIVFTWTLFNDRNRALDGVNLRYLFLQDNNITNVDIPDSPCSFLEMLIALSQRAMYISEDFFESVGDWFFHLLENIDLKKYDDETMINEYCVDHIRKKISCVLNRSYYKNGVGGLFPLTESITDQRCLEIWYQLNSYISKESDWINYC